MKKSVLFLRAYYGINIHSDAHGELGEHLNTRDVFPDLTLLTAATIFNESPDYDVKFIDAVLEDKMLPDELLKKLEGEKYDIVILKTVAPTIRSDIELLKSIKKIMPEADIKIGGHTAKIIKGWIDKNVKEIDQVIEEPLDEFALHYIIEDSSNLGINDMPTPDYTLVNYKKYTDDNKRIRLTLQGSRGCPMACTYCPYKQYYRKVEFRDVDRIIEDMKILLGLGAEVIQFRDQFFTSDRDRVKEFCKKVKEENIVVPLIVETRLTSLDEELISLLKEAGVFLICFGVESGDMDILKNYNSIKGKPERMKELIAYANGLGIITMAFYILGFPEETWDKVENTYKFADYLDSSYAIFNEYEDCKFDIDEDLLTPELFTAFGNTTTVDYPSVLNSDERKYLVWLYSILYTMRISYEGAYHYNYEIVRDNKKTIRKMQPFAYDLNKLSSCVREMWESGEHEK